MNFDPTMPTCPVCSAATVDFIHRLFKDDEGKWAATERGITFDCGAQYKTRNERSYKERHTVAQAPEWKAKTPCSKAQEIALKLLADATLLRGGVPKPTKFVPLSETAMVELRKTAAVDAFLDGDEEIHC